MLRNQNHSYLKSKRAVNFIRHNANCTKKTAKAAVELISENIDNPSFVLGINGDRIRVFWNTPTESLAVGIEDHAGGMFIAVDGIDGSELKII